MVGGSGMYADAVMFGLDKFPEVPKETRKQINYLQSPWTKITAKITYQKDPIYFNIADKNNPSPYKSVRGFY